MIAIRYAAASAVRLTPYYFFRFRNFRLGGRSDTSPVWVDPVSGEPHIMSSGALRPKQLIAVAVAHVTQSPYCIRGHTKAALRYGATREELLEAIWVAAEMRAGGAYAHSAVALSAMDEEPTAVG